MTIRWGSSFRAMLLGALLVVAMPATAHSAFGISQWDGDWSDPGGGLQAAGHPDTIRTSFRINTIDVDDEVGYRPDGYIRDAHGETPPGLVPNPNAVPKCPGLLALLQEQCSAASQVGYINLAVGSEGKELIAPRIAVYNMSALPGTPGSVAFNFANTPIYITGNIRNDSDYGLTVSSTNISQAINIVGVDLYFWGVPGDPIHDADRVVPGSCLLPGLGCSYGESAGLEDPSAFLTNPTSCTGAEVGLPFTLKAFSWQLQTAESTFTTHAPGDPSQQLGITGCDVVPFDPTISAQLTTGQAETPTGLEFDLRFPQQGAANPDGLGQAHLQEAVVKLPEGMTINPSYGDGVKACSAAQIGLLSGDSEPIRFSGQAAQCPDASQIASVEVESPPLETPLKGALYIGQQNDPVAPGVENPFNGLVALYMAIEGSGVRVKLGGEVTPDPDTGQVITTFAGNPQVPFSRFTLKFKGGQRAPLATPAACGRYTTEADLRSWSRPDEVITATSSFHITEGPHGGPCINDPGARSFSPDLNAGTLNNNAGSYSPLNVRMTREDGEQEITSFSADLPPGLVGKLAGIPYCPDAAIEAAKTKTGIQELNSPSCPQASMVGKTLVGSGVGSLLVYAPGKVYLAGPYKGAPISIAAITSATVGPFDLGTVVVRSAFKVDPETAKVTVDSSSSDPIPHIIAGIPVHLRDIRVFVDRPEFTLNPTSCDRFSFATRLTGSGADFTSPLDDPSVGVSVPFQAANCAALPFKPKLSFKLKGGTKRGQFPAFQAVLKARPGDANIAGSTVVLPRSEFIEQGHIRTVCTRVQFAANQCPPGSIYGYAKATTPLFDKPLEGPVYLRSNGGERVLPDLVVSLNGEIDVALTGFVDSVKGRVRNRFAVIPDAPVTKFVLNMQGGKKGLLVNHLDLCEVTSRADVKLIGQNGKVVEARPKMGTSCGKGRKARR